MTNQEIIEKFKSDKVKASLDIAGGVFVQTDLAHEIVKALRSQPCEDAISRQAVLYGLASIAKAKAKSDAQKSLMGRVMFFTERLPSVNWQEPKADKENIHREREQAYMQGYEDACKKYRQEPKPGWIPVSERLPEPFSYVNCTCHSLVDDREDWVVETCYIPQLPNSPYSDWGNIPMLNYGDCEVVAWMYREIPEPYKAESEDRE